MKLHDFLRSLFLSLALGLFSQPSFAGNGITVDRSVTPERKVLSLRAAVDSAATYEDGKPFIKKIARIETFQSYAALLDFAREANRAGDAKMLRWVSKKAVKMRQRHPEYAAFRSLFNGYDLAGWKGLVDDPIKRARMSRKELARRQVKADEQMRRDWKVEDGCLVYVGTGFDNLCTVEKYADFEMYVDWMLDPDGKEPDAGIYLRGTPQVQIWDTARVNVGAQVGSGGLYNNQKHESKPLVVADNALGQWNTFYIKMVGDRVTVRLNGILVVDNVPLENYWDRSKPIFPREQIELQAHGSRVYFRSLYVRKL